MSDTGLELTEAINGNSEQVNAITETGELKALGAVSALRMALMVDQTTAVIDYHNIGGGVDLSFVTAVSGDILAGKIGADANGNPVTGTIQTVKATLTDNVVTVPQGYISSKQTLTVAEMAEPSVSGNVVTISKGYNKVQKTKTIAEAGETTVSGNVVTTPAGYVKSERKTTVGTAKGAETITPGTADHVIPADTYLTGALTVKGEPELLPENIADGKSIFGVAGTHKGGMDEIEFFDWMTILN